MTVEVYGLQATTDAMQRAIAGGLDAVLADLMAQRAEDMQDALRGAGPGGGITPYDTGRLLTTADLDVTEHTVIFENDAAELGRESYAGFAHFSGDDVGGYARDVAALFRFTFGQPFADELERVTAEMLDAS